MTRIQLMPVIFTAVLSLLSRGGAAQTTTPPCTYDRCALRLENTNPMFPGHLVQGIEGRPVATIGYFTPHIALFESSADSIRIPYDSFRSRMRTGNVLGALSLATLATATVLAFHAGHAPGSGTWWAVGAGITLGVGAIASEAGAVSKLDEAIERYNNQLPDHP